MNQPKIVLLNGSSSSGKSTLAHALQQQLKLTHGKDYAIISIDDFLDMQSDQPIYEDDVFEISSKICDRVINLLTSNDGAIIDHVITSERILAQLLNLLSPHYLLLVQVTCPLQILKEREQLRGNRCIGSAAASTQYLYPKDGYDLTVDTFKSTAQECSSQIVKALYHAADHNATFS